jgi:hypothetical protein
MTTPIAALFQRPIKGFTPEKLQHAQLVALYVPRNAQSAPPAARATASSIIPWAMRRSSTWQACAIWSNG